MPATPTHWHLSPNQLAITCDICQQTVSWAEWKRGHTLDHYRDGRWAERMQSWRPDELCQSSPGYQPPPLESGVRELIINTVGAQVPVDVDANTAPNTVCMNGVHGKTDRWWYVAAGPLTLADLHEAIASYVSAHGYAPKRMLVLPEDFQRLSADCASMQPWANPTPDKLAHLTQAQLEAELARRPQSVLEQARIQDGRKALQEIRDAITPYAPEAVHIATWLAKELAELKRARVELADAREQLGRALSLPPTIGVAGCSCLACSVASNTLRMHAETMRGEPARVGRSDVSFEPKHDSCTIAGVKFVAVEKKPRPSIQVEHTPESGRGIATLDFTPARPDNSVAHLDVDLLADDA